jgi:hypothetical protein
VTFAGFNTDSQVEVLIGNQLVETTSPLAAGFGVSSVNLAAYQVQPGTTYTITVHGLDSQKRVAASFFVTST